jgi:hypothetical protein
MKHLYSYQDDGKPSPRGTRHRAGPDTEMGAKIGIKPRQLWHRVGTQKSLDQCPPTLCLAHARDERLQGKTGLSSGPTPCSQLGVVVGFGS